MTAFLLPNGKQSFETATGAPAVAWKLYTYDTGTNNPRSTWLDAGQASLNANPIVMDARGECVVFWNGSYRVRLEDNLGNTIWTVDGVSTGSAVDTLIADLAAANASNKGAGMIGFGPAITYLPNTVGSFFNSIYGRTAAEISAGSTPVNYWYPPQTVVRYGTNTTPETTDMAAAFQAAIDSASPLSGEVIYANANGLSKPLLYKSSNDQGITIEGENKANSTLSPLAIDIKTAGQGINTLLFNQNNNAHLRMINFGTHSTVAYTGNVIYCVEGGGTDLSGQCLFSGVFRDGFVILPSTNSGYLKGTTQNCLWDGVTFENMVSIFTLQGVAHLDNHYSNLSLVSTRDELCRQNFDTNGSLFCHWTNINDYQRLRGVAFDVKNWKSCSINQYALEADSTTVAGDNVGVGKFTDCQYVTVDNVAAQPRPSAGVPSGNTILEFAGSGTTTMKVAQSYLGGVRAVKISNTGVVQLEFDNCDFSTAGSSCFDIAANCTGQIITRGCKFNNAQIRCLVYSVASAVNWYSYNDEFLNAGLSGNVASRNIDLACSGEVIMYNPRIGQNNVSAVAAYYIAAGGGGTVTIYDPVFVGTPPSGLVDPASTVTPQIIYRRGHGGTLASAGTITLPHFGDCFDVSGNVAITSITANSTAPQKGRSIRLKFSGTPTFTDGSNLQLAGNLVATADDTISLTCFDGTNWTETGRSVN